MLVFLRGPVLGPILFLLYINDLPDCILSQLSTYADDSTHYTTYPGTLSPPSRVHASTTLNHDLQSMINWRKRLACYFQPKKDPPVVCVWFKITLFSNPVYGLFTFAGTSCYLSACRPTCEHKMIVYED